MSYSFTLPPLEKGGLNGYSMSINEQISVSVFHEFVRYKPRLALLLPKKDEEEEVDVRQLAAEIISSFPWPIGVELR